MLETDADRLASIRALGGELVTHSAGTFLAIFDNEYRGVGLGDIEIETRGPVLTCRSSDVTDLGKEAVLHLSDAGDYRVRRSEPDNPAPGWTLLLLRR
jgi:hypothetical protein